jgi:hypothetical protein
LGEECLQVVGEREVGVAVGDLSVEGVDLVTEIGFAGSYVGHAGAQLIDGYELFCVWFDHPGDCGARLVRAVWRRVRSRVTGSVVRAAASRLSISARISWGSASSAVMWSHMTVSR